MSKAISKCQAKASFGKVSTTKPRGRHKSAGKIMVIAHYKGKETTLLHYKKYRRPTCLCVLYFFLIVFFFR